METDSVVPRDKEEDRLHWDHLRPTVRVVGAVVIAAIGYAYLHEEIGRGALWLIPLGVCLLFMLTHYELTLWPESKRYRRHVGIRWLSRPQTGSFDDLRGWEIDYIPNPEGSSYYVLRLRWRFAKPFPIMQAKSLDKVSQKVIELAQQTELPVFEGSELRKIDNPDMPHRKWLATLPAP